MLFSLSHPLWRRVLPWGFCAVYAGLSLYVLIVFSIGSEFGGLNQFSVARMLDGTAGRAQVYRVFIPGVARGIIALTPEAARAEATNDLIAFKRTRLMQTIIHVRYPRAPVSLNEPGLYNVAVVLALVYLSLCVYLWILYKLALELFPASKAYAFLAPLLSLLILPVLNRRFALIYDYATLMFFASCLYCLTTRRWRLYLALFVLATLNKETTVYLIFLSAIYLYDRLPHRQWAGFLAAQGIIFVLIKSAIDLHFRHNPGVGLFSSFYAQLSYLFSGYNFYTFTSLLVMGLLLTYRWKEKPELLRYGLALFPVSWVAFLAVGVVTEYRQFLEIVPVGALLITHSLVKLAGIDALPVFKPQDGCQG